MSKPIFHFNYHFEPVGQGLFAWGCIHKKDDRVLHFTWVYDCGTASKKHLVNNAIARYERHLGIRKQIDLLTISHFDADHISGVGELIKKFKIGTLLLPYTDLKQRLVFAFEHGVTSNSNLMNFYLNPTDYLTSLGGPGIDRILVVRPGGGDGPTMPEGNPDVPGDGDFPELKFEIERLDDSKELAGYTASSQKTAGKTSVQFLRRSSKIQLPNLWEFVPYNEEPAEEISKKFATAVDAAKSHLLAPDSSKSREVLLGLLRDVYDEEFGDDSYERNVISLSLYSGPIYPSWKRVRLQEYFPQNFNRSVVRAKLWPNFPMVGDIYRCSMLYTGDGYLDTPIGLDHFVNYFLVERIEKVGVFQVMHHGSKKNWHHGVAARIAPLFSVFSSDPEYRKFGHPDEEVLRDFWRYGAVQVDRRMGLSVGGWLIR